MKYAVLGLVFAAFASVAAAQDAPTITVSGQVQHPLTLTLFDLQKMPSADATIVLTRTETEVSLGKFRGVSLWTLLDKAGLANGAEKNAYLRHTVLVTGSDGYAAAFSEGEIDPMFARDQIILAITKDGALLDRPRLVVPNDKQRSRDVHDVVSIEIK